MMNAEDEWGLRLVGRWAGLCDGKGWGDGVGTTEGRTGELAVVPSGQPLEGKVFTQIGPVDSEERNLHVGQLLWRSTGKTAITAHGEANESPAVERNGDKAAFKTDIDTG